MTHTDDTKQATAHTPEPWDCDGRTTLYATPDESGEMTMIEVNANVTEAGWDTVAFIEAIWPGAEANARRICAAVNACKGISTEALERGIIAELRLRPGRTPHRRRRPRRGDRRRDRSVRRRARPAERRHPRCPVRSRRRHGT